MGNINVACSYLLILYNYNHAYTLVSTQSFLHVSQFRVLSFFTSTSRWELYSRHFCFAAVPDPKGPSALISSQLQYSTSLLVTWPNILVNMVFFEYTACCKGFWHCMYRIVRINMTKRDYVIICDQASKKGTSWHKIHHITKT